MEPYIDFASRHPYLTMALLVVVAMLAYSYLAPLFRPWKTVTPLEATRLINREDAVLLDVREDNEYRGGHIVNSVHIPLSVLDKRLDELEKYKDRPIIVACRTGNRSAAACTRLSKAGFGQVYNLGGGVLAWENANLPLRRT